MLTLYTAPSPNGFKATIALEETGLRYHLHAVDMERGEHREPAFLALNPHGRVPVLRDDETGIDLFESAAILLYIAEASRQLLPSDRKARWAALQWLQFHSSSTGPILGQRVHFEMFAEGKIPSAIERYRKLSEDAFAVLDARLRDHVFLAGEEYSVADIATFGWTHIARLCDFPFDQFTHLSRWHDAVAQRPAVQRGISLPAPATGP